ncbi:hypothetical protein, partial [Bradyrhizobium sp. 151]|uniref:hypothetical protein n=1 Tax=Bradyrhizobium sp. 151 TaxID=2782626 RepID=UPI001FF949D9
QNRRCLNGSDAALDTKAIRQKRGRHRAEKIALTVRFVGEPSTELFLGRRFLPHRNRYNRGGQDEMDSSWS